ncbi:outer membrane protein assembly factor BamA [Gammaproteobacteria bacterium]|nr:outer membrane protein assembly factor BamA [Gammaproteobacteria bacterium]MDB4836191.1 outer membrane protein assembly factor BamA [Gammaproteobacteria bacterium]MDC0005857.1 outer membrane protein assembly factor BamA [Gammaproteobacteria bacterium]MDC1015352.1 outer membrane protein assembly factor BamA [Gammaproteobacteria bacterium]MDC1187360.1 outer membrane protein assembly factor BamA [Gammaproteobacteria bacterium]
MKTFKIYILGLLLSAQLFSFDDFLVSDIRIIGLQRVSTGSIFNVIPISVGDNIDQRKSTDITRSLFATEQFDDIQIAKDGNTLIIIVQERPSISAIDISGNKALKTEQLLESLDGVGIKEGEVYKRSTVEKVKSELVRSYASNGRYGAGVDIEEIKKPRNRIELNIEVDEGKSATIESINIIGNELFSNEDLLDGFELSSGSIFSFLSNDNAYSREKLKGDIESLESFYLNRGYLKFSIESSEISLSKDKKSIFINFNIFEGEQYTINDVEVVGDLPFEDEVYEEITNSLKDKIYSQAQITGIEEFFTNVLGNQGYAFAEVSGNPVIDDDSQEVKITFSVMPGKRTYTRKILFTGNNLTQDYVLRREMRQFEGAWSSDNSIESGKVRLERLGYFKEVNVETVPVVGTDDQIDVIYSVEEENTGSIGGNLGYSDFGLMVGFNLQEQNFLGTGNTVAVGINKNVYSEQYNLSFLDPFATKDGVSLGYNAYFRETDYGEYNVANYLTNSNGIGIQYGWPISDTQRLNLSLTYDKTDISVGTQPAREIWDFVNAEGNVYETLNLQTQWQRVTLNRGMYPTDGASTAVSISATVPGSDLNYYRINLRQKFYQPLGRGLVFGFNGEIGYLSTFGDTTETPFFQNFFAGGPRSLRGFESNTLGPRSTEAPCYEFNYAEGICPNLIDTDGDEIPDEPYYNPYANSEYNKRVSIGGNVKVEGSLQLIFRLPFIEDQRSMRSAFFFDFGNVFSDNCKEYQFNCYKPSIDDLRYSYGVGITFVTGFGPMSFAISKPTNAGQYEETKQFQFTVGNVF